MIGDFDIFDGFDEPDSESDGNLPSGGLFGDLLQEFATGVSPENSSKEDANWKPLHGPQEMAFYSKADELFFGGAAGGGKLLANNTLIPTINGISKRADEIVVGDSLISWDGGATKVLAIYEHKDIDLYRFTFIDGSTIVTGADHLWMHWYSGKRFKANRKYVLYSPEKGAHTELVRGRLGLTKDLYEYHLKQVKRKKDGKRAYWVIIPLSEPVRFTPPVNWYVRENWIDPYFLGLLLGDGTISRKAIGITTVDREIIDYVMAIRPNGTVVFDGIKSVRINSSSDLIKRLDFFGLHKTYSNTKFIPKPYLTAMLDDRFALMQGLMDTDGHIDSRGHMEYTTVSEQLANDVKFLAQSLGAKVTIFTKAGSYRDANGDVVECQPVYRLYMQAKNSDKFFRLTRKRERASNFNGGVSELGRRLVDVEYLGKGGGVCFAVDHPSGLHLATNDFIVTHNTDLMVGMVASTLSPHKKAIVFRSTYPEHKDFIERVRQVAPDSVYKGGNAQKFENLPGGKTLELGSVANFSAAQKYRGRPHDLKLFDELPKMPEEVYTFLIGWARTAEKNVPVRVVSAGNPPTNADEEWVIRRWRPWLDHNHPNPAQDGELRWFATLDGEDTEITPEISEDGSKGIPFDYTLEDGRVLTVKPTSRTFIGARLTDNPYLMATNYEQVLQNMPEPYRSQLLEGKFVQNTDNDVWRVIPVAWVDQAFDRWDELEKSGEVKKSRNADVAYGLDVAEGGQDETVHTKITGNIVQWQEAIKLDDTMAIAHIVSDRMKENPRAPIGVDVIGVGLGVGQRLKQMGRRVLPIKGSRKSTKKDSTSTYGFYNKRSEMWWKLREALDPDSESPLALPRSKKLKEELTSVRYEVVVRGGYDVVRVQNKDDVRRKLRRSPDYANSLMYAYQSLKANKAGLRIF